MPFKIMTWNCLGMEDVAKRALLNAYKAAEGIDIVFLQEGSSTFDNAKDEGFGGTGVYLVPGADSAEKLIELAFGLGMTSTIAPMGGVARKAYYNVVAGHGVFTAKADSPDGADYLSKADMKSYLKKPAEDALLKRDRRGKKLIELRVGRSRTTIVNGGSREMQDILRDNVVGPIQKRVNLMGHRRPKLVELTGRAQKVYHWHAPLGGDVKLKDVGFLTGNEGITDQGSGGELAVAANILFAKFLNVSAQFPANTILVGDLNITQRAVKHIYNTTNVVSSDDGLCHALAHSSIPLTSVTTTLDAARMGVSDHDPIVFTIP